MAVLKRMKAAVVETFGGPVKPILPFTPDNCADDALSSPSCLAKRRINDHR